MFRQFMVPTNIFVADFHCTLNRACQGRLWQIAVGSPAGPSVVSTGWQSDWSLDSSRDHTGAGGSSSAVLEQLTISLQVQWESGIMIVHPTMYVWHDKTPDCWDHNQISLRL